MPKSTTKRLTINVLPNFRNELKIQSIACGKTLKDYVTDALKEHMRQNHIEEDKLWGKMSEKAKKEGLLSVEESNVLIKDIKDA